MRLRPAILACVLFAAGPARAGPPADDPTAPSELDSSAAPADPRRAQQQAAQANAVASLREQVLGLEVGHGRRVRDLADDAHVSAAVSTALAAARPLGGPRWVDEQTCQVQVVVPGSAVADAVAGLVPHRPGGRPDALSAELSKWRRTAFSATGSSVAGGTAVEQARPRGSGGAWAGVGDDDRRRTVAAAQADAVRRALDDLHRVADPLPLGGGVRVGEVLARPAVAARVRAFLDAQPVTHIDFLDDRTVSLSVSVDPPGLARTVQRAVADDRPAASAATAADWTRFRRALERSLVPAVTGTAAVVPAGLVPAGGAAVPVVALPLEPPGWVGDRLDAEGTAPAAAGADRLKQAGLAEAAAVARLREQLLALRVGPQATLADATRADSLLAAGVSRVLSDAHAYRVRYAADGSVTVRLSLDLRVVWDQLRSDP